MTGPNRDSNRPRPADGSDAPPAVRSHYLPRTPQGRVTVFLFLALFACTQPPLVYVIANRIEPILFGLPFLYIYLLVIYFALIGVLIWAQRRRV